MPAMLLVPVLLAVFGWTSALQSWEVNEGISGLVLYGDMILTPLQRRRYGSQSNPVRGVSRKGSPVNRWKDNVIPYLLSAQYTEEQKQIIRDSLAALERISCFVFRPRTTELDFLMIAPLDGCYSYVGKIGRTNGSANCFTLASNPPAQRIPANFEKLSPHEVDYAENYDYKSIMHYDSHAFGRRDPKTNVRLATMIPLKKGVILEDNLKMSATDIRKLNELGKCSVPQERGNSLSGDEANSRCKDERNDCAKMKQVCSIFLAVAAHPIGPCSEWTLLHSVLSSVDGKEMCVHLSPLWGKRYGYPAREPEINSVTRGPEEFEYLRNYWYQDLSPRGSYHSHIFTPYCNHDLRSQGRPMLPFRIY
ncbi:astacin [Ancylostoma ceylanicum]|uniref:Astacin n=1 Tax=Ancylostoma ceylanicum TaxID=53326 RepID=A0A0D6M3W5_9BILA|nr:astacin [Ancylostoma ceylanicum]